MLKLERVDEVQASVFRQFSRVWVKVIHWSMELKSSVKQDHEVCFEKSDFTFERGEQKRRARGAAAMDFSLIKWSVSRKTTLMWSMTSGQNLFTEKIKWKHLSKKPWGQSQVSFPEEEKQKESDVPELTLTLSTYSTHCKLPMWTLSFL